MALAFKLYHDQGHYGDFYVGDVCVRVAGVESPTNFKLRVYAPDGERVFDITDKRATEILPEVFVSAGDRVTDDGEEVKAVISAPRHIRIDRAAVYFDRRGERAV